MDLVLHKLDRKQTFSSLAELNENVDFTKETRVFGAL